MIRLFSKKKVQYESRKNIHTVTTILDQKLKMFALYLAKKTETVAPAKQAACIIASCFFLSLCIGFSVSKTFGYCLATSAKSTTIRAPVSKPFYLPAHKDMAIGRIRKFHLYLDSVKKNDASLFDSIQRARPHLLDSLITAEQLTK